MNWTSFLLASLLLIAIFVQDATPAIILVEWTTASEVETAGFHLYRSEAPAGPFVRVSHQLIPAANDPLVGHTYVFTDTQALPGHTYYYRLEEVEMNGKAIQHGPIVVRSRHPAPIPMGVILLLLFGAAWALVPHILTRFLNYRNSSEDHRQ